MVIKARIKRNTYFDSITLMRIAQSLTGMEGIEDAAAIMATPPNLQLLAEAGLTPPDGNAGAADVLLVVRASDDAFAESALQSAEEQLARRPVPIEGQAGAVMQQPRSLEQAVRLHPDSRVAAISVPGMYAALEADRALHAGLHVFLFSDNVPLADEIALKHLARERDLLLMGPDCGTAMLNGIGLGFVNVVPRGPIGIVSASGTGMQEVMSLAAQQGYGISQAIGCGGRDLSEAVGAITTLQGLALLQEDEQTQVIVLISKPPASSVAERVLDAAAGGNKPVVVIFVGADHDTLQRRYGERVVITRTLTEATEQAVRLCGGAWQAQTYGENQNDAHPTGKYLSALFSGGTLCDEAMHLWADALGPIYSNIPLKPGWRLIEEQRANGHRAVDLGDDAYTRGRPHPMIDPGLRLKRLQEEACDPQVGVILLDIVLGYCSHLDPAGVYAPAIRAAREQAAQAGRSLAIIVSLCGTEGDPQRLSVQIRILREAGAEVYTSNADATQRCATLIAQ